MIDSLVIGWNANGRSAPRHGRDRSRERQVFCFLIKVLRAVVLRVAPDDDPPSTIHTAVPPVLDSVVASPSKPAGDFGPALPHLADQTLDRFAFFWRDRFMVQCGFEILMKAFSTLLRGSAPNKLGDPNPVVGALAVDE